MPSAPVPAWLRERLGVDGALRRVLESSGSYLQPKEIAERSGYSTITVQRRLKALLPPPPKMRPTPWRKAA